MKGQISVALCTFNGAPYIREQLLSIASQTRLPDEVVVCDDGSEDDTVGLIQEFAQNAPFKLKLVRNRTRLGIPKNFEQALSLCTGNLIALCDQDDIWVPDKLQRLEAALVKVPNAGYAFSDALVVNERLDLVTRSLWKAIGFGPARQARFRAGTIGQVEVLLRRNVVQGAAMMLRADILNFALPIPEGWIHDYWLALVSSSCGRPGLAVPQPLIMYRQHSRQALGPPKASIADKVKLFKCSDARSAAISRWKSLLECVGQMADRRTQALIEEAITHVQRRAAMAWLCRRERVGLVWDELQSRRYHRFSSGFASALKDLLI